MENIIAYLFFGFMGYVGLYAIYRLLDLVFGNKYVRRIMRWGE